MKLPLFFLSVTAMLSFSLHGQEPLQEFLFAENALVQEAKEIQFTIKPSFLLKGQQRFAAPLQIEYGFTDRLQAELGFPLHSLRAKREDERKAEAGLLYGVLKNERLFILSVGIEAGIPFSSKKGQGHTTEWEPTIRIGKKIARFDLHAVIGAEIMEDERSYFFSAAGAYQVGHWRTTLEMIRHTGDDAYSSITGGLVWKRWDNVELAAGVTGIAAKSSCNWGIALSMTYEFVVK